MRRLSTTVSNENKATVCLNNNCITVYNDLATVINTIALATTIVIALSIVSKALK